MITIVLTYRNREISILEKCLNSLLNQTNNNFKLILVDYGSVSLYREKLTQLLKAYKSLTLMSCNTQQELWCKSRAINIALKQCKTTYFFIGDVDMIYSPNFVDKLHHLKSETQISYFQVGFLSELESKNNKDFNDYDINFKSTEEATGMTLFNSEILKSINGYDEFYHGWGSEDTDVHTRLINAGYDVHFYKEEVLMLHQWHPKHYRNQNDLAPFHDSLEQINYEYLKFSKKYNKTKTNLSFPWGTYNASDYDDLMIVDLTYKLTNKEAELKAFIYNILLIQKDKVIKVEIKLHSEYKSIKQKGKKLFRKKTFSFLEMNKINDMLLECIVTNLRDKAYQFNYNSSEQNISLTIKL